MDSQVLDTSFLLYEALDKWVGEVPAEFLSILYCEDKL